jgi:hypothetical protein
VNSLNIKSYKKDKIFTILIILTLISCFLNIFSRSQKNLLSSEGNGFDERNTDILKTATIIQPDWEVVNATIQDTMCTINKPSGTEEGDLLILHCTTDGAGSNLIGPFGWETLLPETQTNGQTTALWYKIANTSEPISYNITWAGDEAYIGGIVRITGYNRVNPIQATSTNTGTKEIINPSLITTEENTLILGFHGLDNNKHGLDDYSTTLEAGPTVLYATPSHVGGNDECSAGMYYEIQESPGASPLRTWSIGGNEDWYAATVAINPAISGLDITDPTENEIFETLAPNFNIEVPVPNLDTMWYTLNNGLHNYTFTMNGTINQAAWDALPDGIVNIKFYVNNTLGDIGFKEVNVIKDTSEPFINILNPTINEKFGIAAPDFEVEIKDLNLDTIWYFIFNGTYESANITFTANGTIDQTEWNSLEDGTYIIKFFANDTLGNINSEEVNITKDVYAVVIHILSPDEDELFSSDAPSFIIEISGDFLNTTWYTLNAGAENYIFTDNETINPVAWDALPDGTITVRFYANNTLGELFFKEVNVIKDTLAPTINIVKPIENEKFGVSSPTFEVEILDPHLDTTWYSIFNGTYESANITFYGNGAISQTEWDFLSNGTYTIKFYANDSLENINSEEINITKDLYSIFFEILNPIENGLFGADAPSFIIEMSGGFLNTTWYTLNAGAKNYVFTENGTINQVAWDALPDGTVTARFYANNTLGDIYFKELNVIKDTSSPTINILSPTENEKFGVTAPTFEVEITDLHLDKRWYIVGNTTTKFFFIHDGQINQTLWDSLAEGYITLSFYANDTIGNLTFEEIVIIRSISNTEIPDNTLIIIIVSIIAGIALIGVIIGVLIKKDKISIKKSIFGKKEPKVKIPEET